METIFQNKKLVFILFLNIIILFMFKAPFVFASNIENEHEEMSLFLNEFYNSLNKESYTNLQSYLNETEYKLIEEMINNDFNLMDYSIIDIQSVNENEYFAKIEVKTTKDTVYQYIYVYKNGEKYQLSYDLFIEKVIVNPQIFKDEQSFFAVVSIIKQGNWNTVPLYLFDNKERVNLKLIDNKVIQQIIQKNPNSKEYLNLKKNEYYKHYFSIYENPFIVSYKIDKEDKANHNKQLAAFDKYLQTKEMKGKGITYPKDNAFTYYFGTTPFQKNQAVHLLNEGSYISLLIGSLNSEMINAFAVVAENQSAQSQNNDSSTTNTTNTDNNNEGKDEIEEDFTTGLKFMVIIIIVILSFIVLYTVLTAAMTSSNYSSYSSNRNSYFSANEEDRLNYYPGQQNRHKGIHQVQREKVDDITKNINQIVAKNNTTQTKTQEKPKPVKKIDEFNVNRAVNIEKETVTKNKPTIPKEDLNTKRKVMIDD